MAASARALDGSQGSYLASFGLGSATLAPAILAGLVSGLYAVVAAVSYPSLIFSGDLQVFQATGISMALLGSLILATVVALSSSFPGTVATAQSEPAAVLGIMAGTVTAGLGATGAAEVAPATTVVLIALSSAALGLGFLAIGTFKLANLIRYIPYPVIGGFLAGIGWLVFAGGFAAPTTRPLRPENLASLAQVEALIRWGPGLALAGVLWALQRRSGHFLNLPGVVLLAIALFWTTAGLSGASVAELQSGGWLLGPFPHGSLWTPLPHVAAFAAADWATVLRLVPEIGTLVIIGLITLLLSASSLELVVRRDVDLNRELRAAGLGNVVCGLAGGFPGYHSLGASSLAARTGARVRLVGLIIALLCALTLSFGAFVLPYVPKLVVGLLLLYIGINFLVDSLYDSWFRIPRSENLVLLIVFAGVALIGIIEGIGIGIVAGVVLFAVNYRRINVVRQALSGSHVRSNVDRPESLRNLLRDRGEESHVLKLQGFIFFGTANRLLSGIRDRLTNARARPLRCLTLDFKRVSGLDSSALISFTKLTQYAEQYDFTLNFASLSPDVAHALRTAGIYEGQHPRVRVFSDLDHGLEYGEEQILALHRQEPSGCADPLEEQLRRIVADAAEVGRLMSYLEKGTWREGERLIRQGDASTDMFFVESGRVSVQLETAPGQRLRLRTMGAGTVVGEVALYLGLPRSASVVADAVTTTYRLAADRLAEMKRDDPEVAAMFHEFMARALAARLLDTNRLLEAYSHG